MPYTRTVKVTTTSDNQDVLLLPEVENILSEALLADDHQEYEMIRNSGIRMSVDVFTSDTQVSINGSTYNDLIEDTVYSTDTTTRIYSIRIKDAGREVTLSFRLKRR